MYVYVNVFEEGMLSFIQADVDCALLLFKDCTKLTEPANCKLPDRGERS